MEKGIRLSRMTISLEGKLQIGCSGDVKISFLLDKLGNGNAG